jgi:hypothetical protein
MACYPYKLCRSADARNATALAPATWGDATDPTFANAARYPTSVAFGADAKLYLSTYGNGVLVSTVALG